MGDVVSMFAFRKKKEGEQSKSSETIEEGNAVAVENEEKVEQPKQQYDFEQIMKENQTKKNKLEKKRSSLNEGVKRSYRLNPTNPKPRKK